MATLSSLVVLAIRMRRRSGQGGCFARIGWHDDAPLSLPSLDCPLFYTGCVCGCVYLSLFRTWQSRKYEKERTITHIKESGQWQVQSRASITSKILSSGPFYWLFATKRIYWQRELAAKDESLWQVSSQDTQDPGVCENDARRDAIADRPVGRV